MTFFVAMLATLLPPRYRKHAYLRGPALACSSIQSLLCLIGLVGSLFSFVASHLGEDQPGLPKGAALLIFLKYGDVGTMATAPFALADFWLRPQNLALGYFFFEGLFRISAVYAGSHPPGTAPLYVVSGIHGLIDKARHRRYLGPLVADEIARGRAGHEYQLKVYSCRPRLHWNPYMTVEFEGEFYQCFKEDQGRPPRRFVYYLRKNPTGRIVVTIDRYNTSDVLKTEDGKRAEPLRLRDTLFKDWRRDPQLPDRIVRGKSADDDIQIHSSQPKAQWTRHVTIEFEDCWYQLVKEETGDKSQPYIYHLRKAAPTHPAAVIRHYDPKDF